MWLIQVQPLHTEVLSPATSRIVAVIGRSIDAELGKEGKKGSVSGGLKLFVLSIMKRHAQIRITLSQVIHDMSIHLLSIFVPVFINILPSMSQISVP